MMSCRRPEDYIHGEQGPVAIIPGRVAAWLVRYAEIRRLRVENRGVDREIDAALVALTVAAYKWRASRIGSQVEQAAEVAQRSTMRLSSAEAAELLEVTDRAVRLAIQQGRLQAERVGRRWVIHREDLEHFRASRRAA